MKNKPSLSMFSKLKNSQYAEAIEGGFDFNWARKGVGWGTIRLIERGGELFIDSEGMDKEFCAEIVTAAIKRAKKL